MIFVDTGAWYASFVASDQNHRSAIEWLRQNTEPLITTDYIIDETLTLLRVRGHSQRAITVGEQLFGGEYASVYYLTPVDIALAWQTFRRYGDKGWSFTDCTSKVIIEKLGLSQAFAFDQDFRQFGTIAVVP